ncbi:MAG: GDP-mannose 4,6-dehydratase, partial [Pseudomonadota bacterium]
GTFELLEACRAALASGALTPDFTFLHVSTDEVYGALGHDGVFTESSQKQPNSPYAATKAASDHLVRAWHKSFGLRTLTTHASNNFGPRQYPEKLIPVVLARALSGQPIPVYGNGENVRDWLYVDDHADALLHILTHGTPGQSYNIGGGTERRNIDLVHSLCNILDSLAPGPVPFGSLVEFVTDRAGHDFRYAIDGTRMRTELGWVPRTNFDDALRDTVAWYLAHPDQLGLPNRVVDAA